MGQYVVSSHQADTCNYAINCVSIHALKEYACSNNEVCICIKKCGNVCLNYSSNTNVALFCICQ